VALALEKENEAALGDKLLLDLAHEETQYDGTRETDL
jgi:hypothetical protein